MLRRTAAAVVAALLSLAPGDRLSASDGPLVFAAASLKNVFDEINAAWQAEAGGRARIAYAGSSALAKQIENGAPADLFASADRDWMDYLEDRGLIRTGTRTDLIGNEIVLIAPRARETDLSIVPGFPLVEALGPDGRLAIANTAAVPAGRYGRAALEALGVWSSVEGRLAESENVRAALALVARGEAPLGIVYRTDAAAEPAVKVMDAFPAESHPPIVYPVALTAAADSPEAEAFADFLMSPTARRIFAKWGFTVLAG